VLVVAVAALAPAAVRADVPPVVPSHAATYVGVAEQAAAQIERNWWNPELGWYNEYLARSGPEPLATVWDAFPLFEAIDAIAVADPTRANRAAVEQFGTGAERYWDPDLKPLGGYVWYPDPAITGASAFFDDNGWFGIAFFDAYSATGDRRFLRDAIRAFKFIDIAGWARDAGGGVWWNTEQQYKTAEPLAAAAVLGAEIYKQTRIRYYLKESKKLIAWADAHSWNSARGLYARSDVSDTVMNYVEGMMIGAHVTLCRATRNMSYCQKAEQLANAAMIAFPPGYHWTPETDAIYLRWMLYLYEKDHNLRWYSLADQAGQAALANARDDAGLFTKRWDGGFASNGRLLTAAGTVSLFAWLAAVPT
jgi:Glycosyl hydrolase family 76